MELILTAVLYKILVGADTASLQGLRGKLLVLIGDEMDAQGHLTDIGLLPSQVIDADLGVGHTTTETRLGVRLVLTVTVASGRTAPHLAGWGKRWLESPAYKSFFSLYYATYGLPSCPVITSRI